MGCALGFSCVLAVVGLTEVSVERLGFIAIGIFATLCPVSAVLADAFLGTGDGVCAIAGNGRISISR